MNKALVIGINNYPTAPLNGCINDAESIATLLEKNGDGSPNFDIRTLTAPPNTLNRANIREAVTELFSTDCSKALLYFSGHGALTKTGALLVSQDAESFDEGVSMTDILNLANESPAKDRILIIDCCYSGDMGNPSIFSGEKCFLAEGLSILTACRKNEPSVESGGRGVFTSLVADALQGGAADLRGHVTPGSIYAYVDQALGEWEQRPIFKTNVSRSISLRNIEPPVPLPTLRKIIDYFSSPSSEHQMDPSYEFTEPSANPTNVEIMKDLQKFERVHLVTPVGEDYMYYAALNSKSCKLTAMGYQYWRLVSEGRL